MSNTLKFKGILENEKTFREFHGIEFIKNKALVLISGEEKWHYFKRETLCRSTGFLDKNDKEFFEGDLFKTSFDTIFEKGLFKTFFDVFKVTFDTERGCFMAYSKSENRELRPFEFCKHEIIGNIFENPELF